jgi:uncharacterized membrane protein
MMIIGVVIFLIGLFLLLDRNNQVTNSLCSCHKEDKALNILKERYARGEITADEFTTMKNTL